MAASTKIIRRPDFAGGGLTKSEELRLAEHTSSWISNALRTDTVDRERLAQAVKDLYRVAGRPEPLVVIVPSPRIMAFAGGFAAAIWHLRKTTYAATRAATHAATSDATSDATYAATAAATYAATAAATAAATYAATRAATAAATYAATDAATRAATAAATYAATRDATYAATSAATHAATYAATVAATAAATAAATDAATAAATDAATYAATAAATRAATSDATSDATYAATRDATHDATSAATYAATAAATRAATAAATYAATRDATYAATSAATSAATHAATYAATSAATSDATSDATDAATAAATDAATAAATRAATSDATSDATAAATYAATRAATAAATYAATDAATRAATDDETGAEASLFARIARDILGPEHALFGLQCAQLWYNFYQGGNMWSAWDCYLTAARDVLGLRLPSHEAYEAWERCAKNGGFRLVHEKFCMVSDFPERLRVDEQNRPHSADGPSHRWRDGWELYYWHGVAVTEQIVMRPETLSAQQIANEPNAEVRRVMIERMGCARYLKEAGAELVNEDKCGKLWRTPRRDDTPIEMIEVIDSTPIGSWVDTEEFEEVPYPEGGEGATIRQRKRKFLPELDKNGKPVAKTYFIRVKPGFKTCSAAVAWSFGLESSKYRPSIQT